jgi:hypothetical protein
MPSRANSSPPATDAYSSAAWINALDGMHPMFKHVPPAGPLSTMIVSSPS